MIEQAMIFALGFLAAGLLAIGFMPALWQRAMRLSRRRLEMQLPLSPQEIVAERDQLRAAFAVERRQLEQRMERVQQTKAEDMTELGRRATQLFEVEQARAALDAESKARAATISALERSVAAKDEAINAANQTLTEMVARQVEDQGRFNSLSEAHDELQTLAEERRTGLIAHEIRASGLELQTAEAVRTIEARDQALREKAAALERTGGAFEDLRVEQSRLTGRHEALQRKLESAAAQAALTEEDRRALRDQVEDGKTQMRGLTMKLDVARKSLDEAEAQERSFRDQRRAMLDDAKEERRQQADIIDRLRAENAALQGGLDAARLEFSRLKQELSTLRASKPEVTPPDPAGGDEALMRETIYEIGATIVRLAKNSERLLDGDKDLPRANDQRMARTFSHRERATPETPGEGSPPRSRRA